MDTLTKCQWPACHRRCGLDPGSMAIHWRLQRASLQNGSWAFARDDKHRGSADMLNSSPRIYNSLQHTVTVHPPIADDKNFSPKKARLSGLGHRTRFRSVLTAHPCVSEHAHQAGQEDHGPFALKNAWTQGRVRYDKLTTSPG